MHHFDVTGHICDVIKQNKDELANITFLVIANNSVKFLLNFNVLNSFISNRN